MKLLRDPSVASSGKLVLTEMDGIARSKSDELAVKRTEVITTRKRSLGDRKLHDTMVPGYRGIWAGYHLCNLSGHWCHLIYDHKIPLQLRNKHKFWTFIQFLFWRNGSDSNSSDLFARRDRIFEFLKLLGTLWATSELRSENQSLTNTSRKKENKSLVTLQSSLTKWKASNLFLCHMKFIELLLFKATFPSCTITSARGTRKTVEMPWQIWKLSSSRETETQTQCNWASNCQWVLSNNND